MFKRLHAKSNREMFTARMSKSFGSGSGNISSSRKSSSNISSNSGSSNSNNPSRQQHLRWRWRLAARLDGSYRLFAHASTDNKCKAKPVAELFIKWTLNADPKSGPTTQHTMQHLSKTNSNSSGKKAKPEPNLSCDSFVSHGEQVCSWPSTCCGCCCCCYCCCCCCLPRFVAGNFNFSHTPRIHHCQVLLLLLPGCLAA